MIVTRLLKKIDIITKTFILIIDISYFQNELQRCDIKIRGMFIPKINPCGGPNPAYPISAIP